MNTDPLNLRELPTARAPDALWPAISSRLRDGERRQRQAWLPLSAVASIVVAALCVNLLLVVPNTPQPASRPDAELSQVRAASADLEQQLRRRRNGVIDASSVESLAWMENELGWLDMQLADNPVDVELWHQRVELLQQMIRYYERNNWQAGIQLASY